MSSIRGMAIAIEYLCHCLQFNYLLKIYSFQLSNTLSFMILTVLYGMHFHGHHHIVIYDDCDGLA